MVSKIRNLLSKGNFSSSSGIVQSKEVLMPNNYSNWNILEIQIETMYQIGTFDFKITFSIKTHEGTISF